MTITQIQYFLSAAETLNFTKTANSLHVSQQVVSYQIQTLEKYLGVQLFQREKKQLYLTPGGQLLYETWHRHRLETEQALTDIRLMNRKEQIIRIGIIDIRNILDMILPRIQLLSTRFPNIQWDYYLGNFAEIEHAMDTSSIDLAVTLSTELSEKHPPEQSLILTSMRLYLLMSPTHPLADWEQITIADLKNETFFLFSEEYSYDSNNKVLMDCKLNGFVPRQVRYFSNINQLELSLIAGQGIFVGYDIFFTNNGEHLKKFPLEKLNGLKLSDLVVAWRYPHLNDFAQALNGA